jgi:hypothetical protein
MPKRGIHDEYSYKLVLFKAAAVGIVLTVAFALKRRHCRWLHRVEGGLGRMAQWRGLTMTLVGLLALGGSALVALWTHIPAPRIHDEFSYLLAADTFAHGRLSNPPHPLWRHFESFHILQQPTYATKYPPAQGLMLAVGQRIGGHSIWGVWISAGFACAALYWMLLAWLPPRWALLGGLLVVVRVGILTYWSQSYWGGAVAAMGGALVFGALRRIVHSPRVCDTLLMGVGCAILANSRPYEGLLVSLPAGAGLLAWMLGKHGPPAQVSIRRIGVPLLMVLICTAAAMGAYNLRVTGHVLRMPYEVHEATYAVAPLFLWEPPRPEPVYHHQIMRDFYTGRDLGQYQQQRSLSGFMQVSLEEIKDLYGFYLGPVLIIPLVMMPWVLRNRWMRFALLTCGVVGVGLLGESTLTRPHYAAPITGLVFVLVLQAMRHLRLWRWRGRPTGQYIVGAIAVVCVVSALVAFAQHLRHHAYDRKSPGPHLLTQSQADGGQRPGGDGLHLRERANILTRLQAVGGRHLIIVRYGSEHSPHWEWVYNEANIDGAQVVWAREMETTQNRKLLEYFADRRVWLLEPDAEGPYLVPYPLGPGP